MGAALPLRPQIALPDTEPYRIPVSRLNGFDVDETDRAALGTAHQASARGKPDQPQGNRHESHDGESYRYLAEVRIHYTTPFKHMDLTLRRKAESYIEPNQENKSISTVSKPSQVDLTKQRVLSAPTKPAVKVGDLGHLNEVNIGVPPYSSPSAQRDARILSPESG